MFWLVAALAVAHGDVRSHSTSSQPTYPSYSVAITTTFDASYVSVYEFPTDEFGEPECGKIVSESSLVSVGGGKRPFALDYQDRHPNRN